MANIKISELTELEQVDNDDLLVIVDTSANETKKVKARNVGTGGGGSDVVIISDTQPTSEDNKLWIDTGEVGESFTEITNEYSTSTGKGYSANYINDMNTYSTSEQRVGTYDGKPLYRKMIKTTTPNSTTNSVIATYSNTYKVKNFYGNVYISASNQVLPLNFYFTNEYNVATYCTDTTGNINMKVGIASYQNQNVEIIIEYTKTTD